jgi:hypothetical protein
MRSDSRVLCVACVVIAAVLPVYGQLFQEGNKLLGTGGAAPPEYQGTSVALSADGSTALVGGPFQGPPQGPVWVGGVWVFTHSSGGWSQQGNELVPIDSTVPSSFGQSVALSSDGNTALIGAPDSSAAWVFTRSGGVWSQQANMLVQCFSVALSADGNTALLGGPDDNDSLGAAFVFTRAGTTWAQQGSKLVGSGASGPFTSQGFSVALSADGNTALVGGPGDDNQLGAAWVFTRSGAAWTQLGNKLVGTGAIVNATQGSSVALSGDGATVLLGGPNDANGIGAVWVFTLTNGNWPQQGSKLVGAGYAGQPVQGSSTALSSDGNIALFGGFRDNNLVGATWVFTRSGGVWTQEGNKLVGTGASVVSEQGVSVALSSAGDTAIVGGPGDNGFVGAAWVFAVPTLSISAPASATPGTPFNVTVTALDSAGATVTGYTDSVHFTSNDGAATLPADSTLTNGSGQFPVTLFTAGNQTITATDTVYENVTGTSAPVNVPAQPPRIAKGFGVPSISLNGSTRLGFVIHNLNTTSALSGVEFVDPLPAGLVVATPNGLTGKCGGGTIRAVPGGGKVSLTGATLAANSSCSFSVKVIGTTAGAKNNVTSVVIAAQSGTGNRARATLIVEATP